MVVKPRPIAGQMESLTGLPPCDSALFNPPQTLTAIEKQERLDKPGVRACVSALGKLHYRILIECQFDPHI